MLDISALLHPISDTSRAGADNSFSHEFDQIQDARRSDDPTLDQGEWVTEIKQADWPLVLKLCSSLLKEKSKDLRLAAWFTEAASHLHGFAGFAAGYQLIAGLCEKFWDDLHPEMEDGDIELRVGNLSWMLSQSQEWIHTIPLTKAAENNFTVLDLEIAIRGNGADGSPTLTDIEKARASTPLSFYQQLAGSLELAKTSLSQLEDVIDTTLGDEGPSFSALREGLNKAATNANRLIQAAGASLQVDNEAPPTYSEHSDSIESKENTTQTVAINTAITSRLEALQQLQRVADFFRQTEPHSPVAYLAERAAKWGEMPLHAWLKSVLKEESGALGHLEELLGFSSEEDSL